MKYLKLYEEFDSETMAAIFKGAHGAVNKEELIPLKTLVGKPKFPSKQEFDAAVEYLDIDPDFVFYDKGNMIMPFVYWKGPMFYGIHGLDIELLKMMRAKEYLEQKTKFIDDCLKSHNYVRLFMRVDKKILIPTFIEMYKDIPDKDKYDVFTDLYMRSEYGFHMFPKDIMLDCFEKRHLSSDWKKRMDEFNKLIKPNADGDITIYRGQNKESAKETDAFSWTLSKKTASFFANRFSKGSGKIVTKEINPKYVIDYLNDRNESEVIVNPKKFRS